MSSKKVPNIPLRTVLDGTEEFHLVAGVVRDGGGNVTNGGDSRHGTVAAVVTFAGSLNLSNLASAATARANLGLGSAATFAASAFLQASFSSAGQVQAGTSSTTAVSPSALMSAAVPQVLVDQATIAWDMSSGFNARVTLGGNRIFGTPTNPHEGMTYALGVLQDATGTRVPTWPACFDWGAAGAPTLSTAAGKRDLVFLYCYDAVTPAFRASFNKSA